MKTKYLALVGLLLILVYACSDDDNHYSFVNETTKEAFKADFPNARLVEWEKKQAYYVADFYVDKYEMEAWYDDTGKCVIVEKDILSEELSAPIKKALSESVYSDWRIDDVDEYTREGYETIYVIEVEQGETEINLVYNEEGVLLKEIKESGGHSAGDYIVSDLPVRIKEYLTKTHPNANIVDVDREKDKWEVELIESKTKKELDFTLDTNSWMQTKWEVQIKDIATVVLDVIKTTPYATWTIDDVDFVQNPQGEFYLIEFEKKGEKEIKKLFNAETGLMIE